MRSRGLRLGSSNATLTAREPTCAPGQTLVQIVGRPRDEPLVDRLREREAQVRDAARRRDQDDHHDLGLEQQHLDVAHRRRLERRRRDEREQPRHLRQHLGRRLERLLDLGARRGQPELEPGRAHLGPREQLVDVEPVARLGRHAARRGVRMGQQADPLELGQLVADGRRRHAEPGALDERLRADRLPGRHVLLDDEPEDVALPL